MPCALAIAYLVELVVRFPRVIIWENGDSDVSSAYVLTDAISAGHTGHVVVSTQGSWVPLWYGLLTHGLGFHRVLWEISPALLALGAASLVGLTVARLTSPLRGALATALIVAASPIALFNFTAAFHHNTTIPGVALLGSYLVWSNAKPRGTRKLGAAAIATSLIIGTFVASDELLAVTGLLPFLAAAVLFSGRAPDRRGVAVALGIAASSLIVAVVTSHVMRSLGLGTTTPAVHLTKHVPLHAKWLLQGILRIGNGLSESLHRRLPAVLVTASAVVTIAAILVLYWTAGRGIVRPGGAGLARCCDLYAIYWAGSLLAAGAAYVLTTVPRAPTDRYLLVVVPAVAATVPLAINGRRRAWLSAAGASVFVLASVLALRAGEMRAVSYDGASTSEATPITNYVRSHHLAVGYGGYWDAEALDWVTGEAVHVYPVTDHFGPLEPMYQARAQSWYPPRPHTPSFILLAPYDLDLRDQLPPGLPRPQREVHFGPITLAVYPYDISRYFDAPSKAPGT